MQLLNSEKKGCKNKKMTKTNANIFLSGRVASQTVAKALPTRVICKRTVMLANSTNSRVVCSLGFQTPLKFATISNATIKHQAHWLYQQIGIEKTVCNNTNTYVRPSRTPSFTFRLGPRSEVLHLDNICMTKTPWALFFLPSLPGFWQSQSQ